MNVITSFLHRMQTALHSSATNRGTNQDRLKKWLGSGLLVAGLASALPAMAGVAPSSMDFQASIGLGEEITATVKWSRDPGASDHILVTIPPELELDLPTLPSYCSYTAPVLDCDVPAADTTGETSFKLKGVQTGGFSLMTTDSVNPPVGNPGTVYAGGEVSIGKVKDSPVGNPIIANNSTVFILTPNLAAGSSNVPAGSRIIVRDTLPGGSNTFELTNLTFAGTTPTCNTMAIANSSRVLECHYEGPLTPAQLNASTITVTGKQITNGTNFTNTASISSHPLDQYYTVEQSNAVSYDVTPGTDIVATASLPNGNPTATGSSLTFTFGYRNDGPQMNNPGGRLETVIPPNITPDTSGLPPACTVTPGGTLTVDGTARTGTVISCPVPSLNVGENHSLSIPVTMPAVEEAGVIPVLVTPPAGQGDANPDNNNATADYRTLPPSADLTVSGKSKSPASGAVKAGDTLRTTLTVQNVAASTAPATYSAANPLRVVDYVRPEEIAGTTVTVTSSNPAAAAWQCDVLHGAGGAPSPFTATHTTRVSCYTTNATPLTLNAGASASVTFESTIAALPAGTQSIQLTDRACTGGTALSQLGGATGHSPADTNAGNDCRSFTGQLHATEVTEGKAEVSIAKQSAVDVSGVKTPYLDATIAPADGDTTSTLYWRMVITRPAAGQENIPRLTLTDVIPGIVHLTAPTGMTNHRTGITVTATESVADDRGSQCTVGGTTTRTLTCDFDDVAPGASITVDVTVARPFAVGLHTNTATLTSNNAQLTPSAGGQLSDTATINAGRARTDVALPEKTFTPNPVLIGEYVTYTLTAQNRGPNAIAAGQFVIEDQLNVGAWAADNPSYEDITAPNTTNMACSVTAGLVRCVNTAPIPAYNEAMINIKARITKPGGGAYAGLTFNAKNQADVTLGTDYCEFRTEAPLSTACGDVNARGNNSVTVDVPMATPLIDLIQRKDPVYPRVGENNFRVGDQLRYRFSTGNYGPSRAENWQMKDVLSFPAGTNVTYAGVENVGSGGKIFGAAFTLLTSADVGVSCSVDNSLSGVHQIVCDPTGTRKYLDANEELNFEVVFNVGFTDPAASARPFRYFNQAYVCADETRSGHEKSSGGSPWECTIDASTGLPPTGAAGNNIGSAASVIFPVADLTVSKQTLADPSLPGGTPASPIDIGQPVLYKLVLSNLGESATTKIRFVDTLPAGFEWLQEALPVTIETGSPTHAATLPVLGAVPADGENANGCFISNGITDVGPTDRQEITCDLSGLFSKNDAVAVALRARAKPGYTGPYGAAVNNDVEIMPGRIKTNRDGTDVVESASVDNNPNNNSANSPVEVRNTSIGGRVFVDLNNNGDQDGETASADQGIGGVMLTLSGTDKYGNPVSRTVTTSSVAAGTASIRGDYLFDNLAPSDAAGYTITQTQPAGFVNGDPQANTIRTVRNVDSTGVTSKGTASNPDADSSVISGIVIEGGGNGVQFDFPEQTTDATSPVLKISGYVYVDADNDGTFDGGETPLSGVTVTLVGCAAGDDNTVDTVSVDTSQPAVCTGDDTAILLTTTTGTDGSYSFPLNKPGRYTVIQQSSQPVVDGIETLRGKTTAGTVELIGGTVGGGVPGTATTVPSESATVPSSISNILIDDSTAQSVNNNFGEVLPASISGFVYTEKGTSGSNFDSNTDWPFAGVTVTLTGTNDLGQSVSVTRTTASDGSYSFEGLRPSGPGGYTVNKTNPNRPADPVQNENPGSYPGNETAVGITGSNPGTRNDDETVTGIVVVSGSVIEQTNFAVLNGTRVELALAKTHTGDIVVGQQATYTLTITNTGDSPTFGALQLADTLPPGMSLIATNPITSAMGTISNMVASGQTVTFDFLPTVPLPITNGTATVQVHVDVVELAQGDDVINYATVTGGGDPYVPPGTPGPGCTDPHCAEDKVKVFGPPVLALAKTGPATLVLGNAEEYTLTITNSGEAATIGVLSLIEHLPPGLDLDPANPLTSTDGVISNVVSAGDITTGVIVTFDFDPHTPLAATNGTAAIQVPVTISVDTPIGVSTNYASVGGGGDRGGNPPTPGSACTERRCANVPANVEGAGLLSIIKTANKRDAELGDMVTYTLEISNISQAMVVRPNIVDRLPQGFRLIENTSRVSGAMLLEMKGAPGPVITYSLDQIAPGAKVTITYRVRLGVGSMQGDGVNRASAECPLNPNTKCSNEARYRVKVTGGVFTNDACIVGMVYVDCNGNQIKDHEELGIPGVRMYAENGLFLISDSEGKYSYCGFSPKTHVLKVDQTTLPRGSRLVSSSNRNVGDANSLFLDLKNGELQRADFIEGSCSNTVLEQVKARRTQGEISAPHVEKKGGVGFTFEGKAPNYPQQGTDSTNQVIVKPRMDSREAVEKAVPAETLSERDTPLRQLEINQGGRDAR